MQHRLTIFLLIVFQTAQACPWYHLIPNTLCQFFVHRLSDPSQCDSSITSVQCSAPICYNKNCSDYATYYFRSWSTCLSHCCNPVYNYTVDVNGIYLCQNTSNFTRKITPTPEKSTAIDSGSITGIVVGIATLIFIAILLVCCCRIYKKTIKSYCCPCLDRDH